MRWAVATGADAERFRAAYVRSGRPIPDNLFPPSVTEGWEPWLEAFWELGTDRQFGGGAVGPLPAASIDRHTSGWPSDEAALFRRVMRALDGEYLDAVETKREAETKK